VRKCLKVEFLGRIEYDFQKSRVTGPWDHKDSVSAKKSKQKFHACVPLKPLAIHNTGKMYCILEEVNALVRSMDPQIRIRIPTKMSYMRNTATDHYERLGNPVLDIF
jgi:hypothetical protein